LIYQHIPLKMIFATTLLLPLAVSVSAGVLQERQFTGLAGLFGGKGGGFGSVAKLAGVEKLEPEYRKTAQRTLTKFGREYSSFYTYPS
jgi:hypothetical protein